MLRYNPNNENGTVYHTNHPVVNNDLKPWFAEYDPKQSEELKPVSSNSYLRFKAIENRMASKSEINDNSIKEALRSKDNEDNPVCKGNNGDGKGFTFASVIMTFSEKPTLQVLAGPPDQSDYETFVFSEK